MKKFFSILLALALILSMSSVAMAASITISGGADGSIYAAYKLLGATDGGDGKFAYTLNDTYSAILKSVTGKNTQSEIVAYIGTLDASGIRAFSDAVYEAIIAADPAIEADYTSVDGAFVDVAQGYYLIAETEVGDAEDTFSLVMLDTAGENNITVNTKEDKPTIIKKVLEKNDSTNYNEWGDSADHDIGDVVQYRITGTISSKYANYSSYYYSITDEMVKGLTYNEDAKIYVLNGSEEHEVTEYFKITLISNEETELAGFRAECNLKELDVACDDFTITAATKIQVRYTVILNENAVKGPEGNENYVYLEYETNPYLKSDGNVRTPDRPGGDFNEDGEQPGEGEQPGDDEDTAVPGKTPVDINIVFTIDAIVNKVDESGKALGGAGFTLFKWIKTDEAEGWQQIGEELSGTTTFTFEGLDSGIYKLVETTIPEGYNECDDVEFEVACVYDKTVDPPAMTALTVLDKDGEDISTGDDALFSATLALGQISTNVVNKSGAELPETGGIGTHIFYIIGAVLVLGTVVLLIAKKRMRVEE